MNSSVTVVGSLNVDYFTRVATLPKPGETVAASDFVTRFGGKGANQAIAAARQGAEVRMVGCLGADEMGQAYRERLNGEGIEDRTAKSAGTPTGSAFISVDEQGENTIVVAAGANGQLDGKMVEVNREVIENSGALLVQFETTMSAVRRAVEIATDAEVPVIVNPSPLNSGFPWSELPVDYLIANETEAARIDDFLGDSADLLVRHLIITQGAKPTLWYGEDGEAEIPTIKVNPVDTVGAGDAFAGTFAANIVQGAEIGEAIRRANIAGALATLKVGAQEAIPTEAEVDSMA